MENGKIVVYIKETVLVIANEIKKYLQEKNISFDVEEFYTYLGINNTIIKQNEISEIPAIQNIIGGQMILQPTTRAAKGERSRTNNGTNFCTYLTTHKGTQKKERCTSKTVSDLNGCPFCKQHLKVANVHKKIISNEVFKIGKDGKEIPEKFSLEDYITVLKSVPDKKYQETVSSIINGDAGKNVAKSLAPIGGIIEQDFPLELDQIDQEDKVSSVTMNENRSLLEEKFIVEKIDANILEMKQSNYRIVEILVVPNNIELGVLTKDKWTESQKAEVADKIKLYGFSE
jgi:hypothetical protein